MMFNKSKHVKHPNDLLDNSTSTSALKSQSLTLDEDESLRKTNESYGSSSTFCISSISSSSHETVFENKEKMVASFLNTNCSHHKTNSSFKRLTSSNESLEYSLTESNVSRTSRFSRASTSASKYTGCVWPSSSMSSFQFDKSHGLQSKNQSTNQKSLSYDNTCSKELLVSSTSSFSSEDEIKLGSCNSINNRMTSRLVENSATNANSKNYLIEPNKQRSKCGALKDFFLNCLFCLPTETEEDSIRGRFDGKYWKNSSYYDSNSSVRGASFSDSGSHKKLINNPQVHQQVSNLEVPLSDSEISLKPIKKTMRKYGTYRASFETLHDLFKPGNYQKIYSEDEDETIG